MKKQVLITVQGRQTNDCGEQDTQELVTVGEYICKDQVYYLLYKETEMCGMEGTTTSVKVEGERVVLNRMGATQLKQIFQVGETHQSNYVTPYGRMLLNVLTARVDVDLTEVGGSINLEYELTIGAEKVSDNKLFITVKEV